MILAAHQPNFMPYMGFFYKMYMCDVFALSDTVQFTTSGFQNYNFILVEGGKTKLTIPVSNRNGAIRDVTLCNWEHWRKKIWRTLKQAYSKAPYFEQFAPAFEEIFSADYKYLWELNYELIMLVRSILGLDCELVWESDLHVQGLTPTQQILSVCRETDCDTYLSGAGAIEYLDEAYLNENGVLVKWSDYQPSIGDMNLSVFDYIMNHGAVIPPEWVAKKEAMQCQN